MSNENNNEKILVELIKNKPKISPSTLKTYRSILSTSNSSFFDDSLNLEDILKKPKEILQSIKEMPITKKRTFLGILVNLSASNLDTQDIYRKEMTKQTEDYLNKKNEVPKKDRFEDWITKEEIQSIYNELEKRAKCLEKLNEWTMKETELFQQYVILSLLSGIYIPVRRLMDFTKFKIANIDEKKDNFMKKNKLYFNAYKTASTYGEQVVKIPKKLQDILKKWLTVNPTEFLLFNENFEPLSETRLNQILHKIFGGRKISVNVLRSVYLESIYPDNLPKTKELKNIAEMMGHSLTTALESYR